MIPKYLKRPRLGAYETLPDGAEVCCKNAAGRREYFNRIRLMAARQGELCAICGLFMVDVTFEHQDGKGMGGSHQDDRIEIDGEWYNAAAHWKCNNDKGSKRYQWANGVYVPCQSEEQRRSYAQLVSNGSRASTVA